MEDLKCQVEMQGFHACTSSSNICSNCSSSVASLLGHVVIALPQSKLYASILLKLEVMEKMTQALEQELSQLQETNFQPQDWLETNSSHVYLKRQKIPDRHTEDMERIMHIHLNIVKILVSAFTRLYTNRIPTRIGVSCQDVECKDEAAPFSQKSQSNNKTGEAPNKRQLRQNHEKANLAKAHCKVLSALQKSIHRQTALLEKTTKLENDIDMTEAALVKHTVETVMLPLSSTFCARSLMVEKLTETTASAKSAISVYTGIFQKQLQKKYGVQFNKSIQKLQPDTILQFPADTRYILEACVSTTMLTGINSGYLHPNGHINLEMDVAKEIMLPMINQKVDFKKFLKEKLVQLANLLGGRKKATNPECLETIQCIMGYETHEKLAFFRLCNAFWSLHQLAVEIPFSMLKINKGVTIDERFMRLIEAQNICKCTTATVELCIFPGFYAAGTVVRSFVYPRYQ